jgi:hypothetical protein
LAASGRDFAVTPLGQEQLAALDIDVDTAQQPRRVFARACVDLMQRRPHLSGVLGEALLQAFAAKGRVLCHHRSRVVTITPKGTENLRHTFGIRREL